MKSMLRSKTFRLVLVAAFATALAVVVAGAAANAAPRTGGESQIQATLSSMVSEVIKNFGQALQSAARGG